MILIGLLPIIRNSTGCHGKFFCHWVCVHDVIHQHLQATFNATVRVGKKKTKTKKQLDYVWSAVVVVSIFSPFFFPRPYSALCQWLAQNSTFWRLCLSRALWLCAYCRQMQPIFILFIYCLYATLISLFFFMTDWTSQIFLSMYLFIIQPMSFFIQ